MNIQSFNNKEFVQMLNSFEEELFSQNQEDEVQRLTDEIFQTEYDQLRAQKAPEIE